MNRSLKFLVTGGAGFIGSSLIRSLVTDSENTVCCLDKLTYAGDLQNLDFAKAYNNFSFVNGDISSQDDVSSLLTNFRPDVILNLAAESHVDRSISGPAEFIKTNILGTYVLLDTSLNYFKSLSDQSKKDFLFYQISTDEVFGDLGADGVFLENSPYRPSSPYSASKASADHLVRAWGRTYGLPYIISHSSNNYGPNQNEEKLIPLVISKILKNEKIPVFGNGENVRDWIHVTDHVEGILMLAKNGKRNESYNIGGSCEKTNLEIIKSICMIMDELRPGSNGKSWQDLMVFVDDRPGHDFRYALSSQKIFNEVGWQPKIKFDAGLFNTVKWYLDNQNSAF